MRSQSKVSTVRELLAKSFDMVVCLDHEESLGVSYGLRAGETGVYGNGYKPDGVSNESGSWKLLVSKISYSVNTPLFLDAMNSGQRGGESKLNFAMECHN